MSSLLAERLAASAPHLASIAQVRDWVRRIAAMTRPAGVALASLPLRRDVSLQATLIVNGSYPPRWLRWYLATRADRLDPVLQQALSSGASFAWKTPHLDTLSPAARAFMAAAADYGLSAGAIAVCCTPTGRLSCLAVAGPPACPYRRWLAHLIWLIHSAHAALTRLAREQARRILLRDHEIRLLHALQCTDTIGEAAILAGVTEPAAHQTLWRLMRRTGMCRLDAIRHLAAWQPLDDITADSAAAPSVPIPFQMRLFF